MTKITTYYLNGLGNGNLRPAEKRILEHNRARKINYKGAAYEAGIVTANINWRSQESAAHLRKRVTAVVSSLLAAVGKEGKLIIQGSSAGGHLAVEALVALDDPRVSAILHSARVKSGDLPKWDPRTIEHCAHLGTPQASQSFYDGIKHFEAVTEPTLNAQQRSHLLITKPWFGDQIVPPYTMDIEGVQTAVLPVIGHGPAIGFAMLMTPSLVEIGRI